MRPTSFSQKLTTRMRRLVAVVTVAMLVSLSGVHAGAAPSSQNAPRHHHSLQPMAVQFNARGGNGNAFTGFNVNVAHTQTNNVWTRLVSRGPHVATVGLNELCITQYQMIVWQTAAHGFPYGYAWHPAHNTTALHDSCGDQFGIAALVNGGRVGNPVEGPYVNQTGSATRGVACAANLFYWSCSTHLHPNNTSVTRLQEEEYRNITAFLSSAPKQTFAAGDFNIPYSSSALWYVAWSFGNGFAEADYPSNRATHGLGKIDYLFRKHPAGWSHPPYIADVSWSDHHWLQGYL